MELHNFLMSRTGFYSMFVAVFLLGMLVLWALIRARKIAVTGKRAEMVLGLFFAIVGVIITIQMVVLAAQFRAYVEHTRPIDDEQTRCGFEATRTVNKWVEGLYVLADSYDQRDQLTADVLMQGLPVTPEQRDRLIESIKESEEARTRFRKVVEDNPLILCYDGGIGSK